MKITENKIKRFSIKYYLVIFIVIILIIAAGFLLFTNKLNNTRSTVNLITNDIGEWTFIEKSKSTDEDGIPIHIVYYNKIFSDSRISEIEVDIYEFTSRALALKEINKKSSLKICDYVKEKITNIEILDCFGSGILWASNNLIINIKDSPRIHGLYVGAYDLIVCPVGGCEKEYAVNASKVIFDFYIKKYPVD